MKIKLYDDAAKRFCFARVGFDQPHGLLAPTGKHYYEMLLELEGQWLPVDTKYLFEDQYNTLPIPGVSDIAIGIHDDLVESIMDDERPGKAKCRYCGTIIHDADCNAFVEMEKCPYCEKIGYLTIFKRHPKAIVSTGEPRKLCYAVDIPDSTDIKNFWVNIGTFGDKKSAVAFVKEHFGGDDEGRISLLYAMEVHDDDEEYEQELAAEAERVEKNKTYKRCGLDHLIMEED